LHKLDSKGVRGAAGTPARAHCFPEIASASPDDPGKKCGCALPEGLFQRFDFSVRASDGSGAPAAEDFEQKKSRIEEQAYRRGFSEGQKKGIESEKQSLEPILQNFQQALRELEKVKEEIYRSAERESVDLALAIAKKIVYHEVSTSREAIVGVVRQAIRQVADRDRIRVRLCPKDLQLLVDPKRHLSGMVRDDSCIVVEGDESIASGGCVIETDMGDVDARIEQQLQVIEETLRIEMQQAGDGGGAA
jgi:flagellar assembly protein FliH